jgi:hypothetical protein
MYEFAGSKSAKLVVQKIQEMVTRSALVYCLSGVSIYKKSCTTARWFPVFHSTKLLY